FLWFGETVLRMIVERYLRVVIYSLGMSIFIRMAGGMVDQLPDLSDIATLLEWLLLMIVFYVALQTIMKSAFGVLSASFMTFSASMGAVWSGAGPGAGPGLWDRTKQVAGGAVSGALMMGGPQGALLGAAGTMLGLPMMMRGGGGAAVSQASESLSGAEPARGDVFRNNGAAALDAESVPDAHQQIRQPETDIFNPPRATAETIASTAAKPSSRKTENFGATTTTKDAARTARTISPEA
ncbi:MAG: hypothetical protein L3J16_03845, partial [Anaerolineales bacterium]|nr:hypothetical protein [Anaerolineales bacterium]